MKKKINISLIFAILLSSCFGKNDSEFIVEHQYETETHEMYLHIRHELNKTMFVNASAGLRVRDSPNIYGEVIGVLENLSTVFVVKEDNNTVKIDGTEGEWTFIETDEIQGWVFGGFLSSDLMTILIETERQARIAQMDTVMYVGSSLWGVTVRDSEIDGIAPSGTRRLSYATEVRISGHDRAAITNDDEWIFFLSKDTEGYIRYRYLVEAIIPESILGHWYDIMSDAVWYFDASGRFSEHCVGAGNRSREGLYILNEDNKIILSFDYYESFGNALNHSAHTVPRRLSYEKKGEIIFLHTREATLNLDGEWRERRLIRN